MQPSSVTRSALIVATVAALVAPATPGSRVETAGQAPASPAFTFDPAEFPGFDSSATLLLGEGLAAKEAAQILNGPPDNPALPAVLFKRGRVDESVDAMRRLIPGAPKRIPEMFSGLFNLSIGGSNVWEQHSNELAVLLELSKSSIATLPREDAAVVARALINVELRLDRRRPYATLVDEFITTYAGTAAALEAEVDRLSQGPLTLARLAAFDDFADKHPNSCAGAKAMLRKASTLASNASSLHLGPDPTPVFLQVIDIERNLESGKYGPTTCSWVKQAPDVIVSFSFFRPVFSSRENLDKMIGLYREFVLTHFALDGRVPTGNGVGYIVAGKMGELYAERGDRVGGVESLLTELEQKVDPGAVRLLRAYFYIRESIERPATRDAMIPKATATLDALQSARLEPYSRRALAALGSLYVWNRDYKSARSTFQQYLARYPTNDYAWLAALREGQAAVEVGDLASAAERFESAAEKYTAIPVSRVIAHAYAADANVALGRIDAAARDAQLALDEWDDDFGVRYRIQAQQSPRPGDEAFALPDDTTVVKDDLRLRALELGEASREKGGALLEQARWLAARGRLDDSATTLARAAADTRGGRLEASVRALKGRVTLDRALAFARADNAAQDQAAAMTELDLVTGEPADMSVFAAKVAKATLRSRRDPAAGDSLMQTALHDFVLAQPHSPAPPHDSLDADLVAIRNEVFRPLGGGVYAGSSWNAFKWPATLPPYLVVNPELVVTVAHDAPRRVTLRQPIARLDNVIFLANDDLALFTSMIRALGGTAHRAPTQVMETPNQPVGAALDVRALWDRFFPTRQGHWSGWVFESYPIITRIEFQDRERTKAMVAVGVGYSGATVVMVKEAGVWYARELTGMWVT